MCYNSLSWVNMEKFLSYLHSYCPCYLLIMFIFSANGEYFNASTLFEDYIANGFQYKPRNPSDARDDTKKYDKHGNPNNRYRFISFDTRNDNIEVGFEFSVPFLSIPVQRSLQTVQTIANTAMGPMTNVNVGAVALAGIMVGTGVATAYLWRTIFGVSNPTLVGTRGGIFRPNKISRDSMENDIWKLVESIENTLQKYGIDATACTQRMVCSLVKSSSTNVSRGSGTSTEKIIDGITSLSWILRMTSGSAIEDAIRAGRFAYDCEKKYSGCKLKMDNFDDFMNRVMRVVSTN